MLGAGVCCCLESEKIPVEAVRGLNTLIKSEKANPGACNEENNGQKVFGVDWNCQEPKHKALKETA